LASILHHVGKPSLLNTSELALIQPQTVARNQALDQAAAMVSDNNRLTFGSPLISSHILQGDDHPHPLAARIVAAIDALDSFARSLPASEALRTDQVMSYLKAQCGGLFDHDVALALLELAVDKGL
jgi:hypothetical protein